MPNPLERQADVNSYSHLDHWEFGSKHNELERQLGRVEVELNRRRAQDRHLVRPNEWPWRSPRQTIGMEPKTEHRNAFLVSAELGFNVHNFRAFIIEIPPGGTEGAYHMHGEAIKFYLQGRGKEIVEEKEYEVGEGDLMLVPANTWHGTQNPSSETLRFFAVAHTSAGAPITHQPIYRVREDMQVEQKEKSGVRLSLEQKDPMAMEGWELGRLKHDLLEDLGRMEDDLDRRRSEDRHVMRKRELEWSQLDGGAAAAGGGCRFAKGIFPELGYRAHNFAAFFVEIGPGGQAARHTHGEQVKLYLQGHGKETIGERVYDVEKGDVIFIPANVRHGTQNTSPEPLSFYSVVQARRTPVALPAILGEGF